MKEIDIKAIQKVNIFDIDSQGRGVGRLDDGQIVFVPFTLPGESVLIKIVDIKKNYALAKLISIENECMGRINSPCKVFGGCGGCNLQHLNYIGQLEYKTKLVELGLKKLAGIKDTAVSSCRPSQEPFNYRNKAEFKIECKNESVSFGFYEEGSHTVKDVDYCYICSSTINMVLKCIKDFLNRELTLARHLSAVTIRSLQTGVLINVHSDTFNLPEIGGFISHLKDKISDFGLFITVFDQKGKKSSSRHIFGIQRMEGSICGIKYEASLHTFLQVNSLIAEKLYLDAVDFFGSGEIDIAVDAYCGIGILTALLSKRVNKVYGIEIVEAATSDAICHLKNNNINNAAIITGDCSFVMSDIFENISKYDSHSKVGVLLDPPRKGCSKAVIDTILKHLPQKIAYISCDSATLCRDLSLLGSMYEIVSVTPYDMFPQTAKVETLALLRLLKSL